MLKYKNNTNSKLIFNLKFITNKDYEALDPYDAIIYDRRNFYELYLTFLKQDHPIINLFFHYSIMEPLWVRLIIFFFNFTLIFTASAFFFSDDYIDQRAETSDEESVI